MTVYNRAEYEAERIKAVQKWAADASFFLALWITVNQRASLASRRKPGRGCSRTSIHQRFCSGSADYRMALMPAVLYTRIPATHSPAPIIAGVISIFSLSSAITATRWLVRRMCR
jgi:hypothetical protein